MTRPLTPPDADLQDYAFMPLHVARLRDSDLAAEEHPEACWYAVLLWAASWHQLPAGSLPNNDAVLTKLIGLGRDVKTFRKHKAGALRGFVLCDDGRLYHPVVAEQVLAGWRGKLEQRWRTECARIKKANQRNGSNLPLPTFEEFHARLPEGSRLPNVHEDIEACPQGQEGASPGTGEACPQGNSIQERETGTGTGRGTVSSDPDGSGGEPPDLLADLRGLPDKERAWKLGLKVLMDRGGHNRTSAGKIVGKWARDHGPERVWDACEAAWDAKTLDPVSYVEATLKRLAEDANDPLLHPSEIRQHLWMRDYAAGGQWREHERGPPPGHPGCRVDAKIQREYGVEPLRGAA